MIYKEERPWGWFEILFEEANLKIKRIMVKPGAISPPRWIPSASIASKVIAVPQSATQHGPGAAAGFFIRHPCLQRSLNILRQIARGAMDQFE